jgi:hypothetical protein
LRAKAVLAGATDAVDRYGTYQAVLDDLSIELLANLRASLGTAVSTVYLGINGSAYEDLGFEIWHILPLGEYLASSSEIDYFE